MIEIFSFLQIMVNLGTQGSLKLFFVEIDFCKNPRRQEYSVLPSPAYYQQVVISFVDLHRWTVIHFVILLQADGISLCWLYQQTFRIKPQRHPTSVGEIQLAVIAESSSGPHLRTLFRGL